MKVEVRLTDVFLRQAKKLLKKYVSLKQELAAFQESLLLFPEQGDNLGPNLYKVRLGVKSKGKGKSGGLRVITYIELEVEEENGLTVVNLLAIYDKSEIESLSQNDIKSLIDGLGEE